MYDMKAQLEELLLEIHVVLVFFGEQAITHCDAISVVDLGSKRGLEM